MRDYWKAIVAGLAALAALIQTQSTDNVIDTGEKLLLVAAFFGAVLVYGASNPTLPFWQYTKALAQAAAGIAGYLALEWSNGASELTTSQWVTLAIIVVGALGVAAVKGPQLVVSGQTTP